MPFLPPNQQHQIHWRQTHKTHKIYLLVIDRLSFIHKMINCMHQTWPTHYTGHKASSHLICTQSAFTTSATISVPRQLWQFFSANTQSQRTLLARYFTTLSPQMLTAIKQVADDNFCFRHDSTPAHHACNTVKLQESELPTSFLFQ